jgi:hypothetical protein
MPASRINGLTVAYTAVGGAVLWSGIAGTSLSTTFRDLLAGTKPSSSASEEPIAPAAAATAASGTAAAGNTGASSATAAANQATAKLLAAPYGWSTGTQWADLVSLWNSESGWSATAQNPTSTAYGIAQFLDTTWATVGATKTSIAAAQIAAGLKYIKQRYGSPSAAWANEVAEGSY